MKSRSSFQITRAVLFALVLREIQALIGRRRMGAFWALAEPVLHMLAFTVFMSLLRGRGDVAGHPYPAFMIVALSPFLAYRRIAMTTAEGVKSARALFVYKQITPIDAFLARAIVIAGMGAVVYTVIVGGFAWYGWDMSIPYPLQWIGTLILGFSFAFGLGLVLAAVVNAIPESLFVIRMLFLPLYFISGVVIPPSHLPPRLLPYLMWNPFLHLSELTHEAALTNYTPIHGISATYVGWVALIFMCAGLGLYRVLRLRYVSILS